MNTFLKRVDLKDGVVNSIDTIYTDTDVASQLHRLREDMGYISYFDDSYIIDYGWTPSFSENGSFKIYLIKDGDWFTPLWETSTRDLEIFVDAINKCVSIIYIDAGLA